MVGVLENVAGSRVNRYCPGQGGGVGFLSGVQGESCQAILLLLVSHLLSFPAELQIRRYSSSKWANKGEER